MAKSSKNTKRHAGKACVMSEVNRMKTEFVSFATHELRTPLSNITEAVAQVVDGLHGEIGVEQKKILEIAHRNCMRMGNLISELVDMSRVRSGKIAFGNTFDQVNQQPDRKLDGGRSV